MFVLLLGCNHSSIINSYCIGLEAHNIEHKALSFEFNRSKYVNYDCVELVFKENSYNRVELIKGIWRLLKLAKKADVIHVFSDFFIPSRLQSFVYKRIFKRKSTKYFITFTGSDVRIPEIELEQNPFFKYAYFHPNYEGRGFETQQQSLALQKKFSELGFNLVSNPEVEPFIQPSFFKKKIINCHPSVNNKKSLKEKKDRSRFVIIHAPSNYYAKGTNYVLDAIRIVEEKLADKFEFRLLTNITNDQFQEELLNADLLIDQLIWGWYGVATQQALEYGTAVIAYLEEAKLKMVDSCPIVNATINSLPVVLENFITSGIKESFEKENMAYYIKHHSPVSVVNNAVRFYKEC